MSIYRSSCHLQIVKFDFFLTKLDDFYLFSCLIAVAKTSSTVLKKSGEKGNPCLVPDLREKALSFSPLSMMFAVDILYMAFVMLRYVFSKPTLLRVFVVHGCYTSSDVFFCIY